MSSLQYPDKTYENYTMEQINGQYHITHCFGPYPTEESEIFVKYIPPHMTPLQVFEIFKKAGEIYQLRIMVHYSGYSRGYGFVRFFQRASALAALELYKNYSTDFDWSSIKVDLSIDNRRLLLRDIPTTFSKTDIMKLITSKGGDPGIVELFIQPQKSQGLNNCVVLYSKHTLAQMARKKMWPYFCLEYNQRIFVDWNTNYYN